VVSEKVNGPTHAWYRPLLQLEGYHRGTFYRCIVLHKLPPPVKGHPERAFILIRLLCLLTQAGHESLEEVAKRELPEETGYVSDWEVKKLSEALLVS
jgi:hypothetical protein